MHDISVLYCISDDIKLFNSLISANIQNLIVHAYFLYIYIIFAII